MENKLVALPPSVSPPEKIKIYISGLKISEILMVYTNILCKPFGFFRVYTSNILENESLHKKKILNDAHKRELLILPNMAEVCTLRVPLISKYVHSHCYIIDIISNLTP